MSAPGEGGSPCDAGTPPCYDRGGGVWKGLMGGCPPPPPIQGRDPSLQGRGYSGNPDSAGWGFPSCKGINGGNPPVGGTGPPPSQCKMPRPPPPPPLQKQDMGESRGAGRDPQGTEGVNGETPPSPLLQGGGGVPVCVCRPPRNEADTGGVRARRGGVPRRRGGGGGGRTRRRREGFPAPPPPPGIPPPSPSSPPP